MDKFVCGTLDRVVDRINPQTCSVSSDLQSLSLRGRTSCFLLSVWDIDLHGSWEHSNCSLGLGL